jgi:2'-5' RNA ligase
MNTELAALYTGINSQGTEAILDHREQIDPVLNDLERDQRLALALLIPIPAEIADNFKLPLEAVRRLEPEQYFYPLSDLHVTVLDLISGRENFDHTAPLITRSMELVQNTVSDCFTPFDIDFRGLIASNAAILAAGYYHEGLQMLRDRIRENARSQNIDLKERYQSISAHSTIIRFKSRLKHNRELLALLREYRDFPIGKFQVRKLELVIHDWYNRRREVIGSFKTKEANNERTSIPKN